MIIIPVKCVSIRDSHQYELPSFNVKLFTRSNKMFPSQRDSVTYNVCFLFFVWQQYASAVCPAFGSIFCMDVTILDVVFATL